jgi:hypothetical protein
VSLLDMLRIYAKDFVLLLQRIDGMADFLAKQCETFGDDPSVTEDDLPELPGFINDEDPHWRPLCDQTTAYINPLLDEVEAICVRMGLRLAVPSIKRIRTECGTLVYSFRNMQMMLQNLANLVKDELEGSVFMLVLPERAKYFNDNPPLFGAAVKDKFPEAMDDVAHAGRCLGAGLPTGAIFYLMRVMEWGIRRLAKRLKIRANLVRRKTWDTIIKEINTAIAALTTTANLSARRREVRDSCAEATAHLNNVRIAWRNTVMHAERTYTQEEAQEIFENVKAFMDYLATKVF